MHVLECLSCMTKTAAFCSHFVVNYTENDIDMTSSESPHPHPWQAMARRRNVRQKIVQSLPQIINAFPQRSSVKSCVMIGCGQGGTELEFVSRCLPNVEKLTAVEPDAHELAALKTRVGQLLQNVGTEFCHETAQSWKGADQPFDAVLLFHCLYYIPQSERAALFEKLFDKVLVKGGLVFIIASPINPENPGMICKLIGLLGLWSYSVIDFVDVIQLRDMLTSVGFRHGYRLPIEYQVYAEKPNDDMMMWFVYWSKGTLSLEEAREKVTELLAGEKCLPEDMVFDVFQKP